MKKYFLIFFSIISFRNWHKNNQKLFSFIFWYFYTQFRGVVRIWAGQVPGLGECWITDPLFVIFSELSNFLHCLCPFWQTLIHWWGLCQNWLLQSWEGDLQMNWSAPGALQRSQRLQVCVQSIFSIKYWHPLTGFWRNSIPCSTLISLQKEVDSNSFNFVLFPFYESVNM